MNFVWHLLNVIPNLLDYMFIVKYVAHIIDKDTLKVDTRALVRPPASLSIVRATYFTMNASHQLAQLSLLL